MIPFECWIKIKLGIISPSADGVNSAGCKYNRPYRKQCERCKYFSASKYAYKNAEFLVKGMEEGIKRGVKNA